MSDLYGFVVWIESVCILSELSIECVSIHK